MQTRGILLALAAVTALSACSRESILFSETNARAHVEMLASTIGSRPVGTAANARARAYIIDQLKLFGYEVRVQETDARAAHVGLTARVSNIIGVLQGERREAVGLLSHYDSSPEAPGAADDAFGVAVSLEAARVIATRPRQWTTFVLVTDAEEVGLMGAEALMTDREVSERLKAYVNVEATGSAGPSMLFETGPANHWILKPWARHAPHPRGGSFAVEVYRRLPNDTDFSVLRRHEIPGLNFAIVGDSYAYHTARDTADRLAPAALRETGRNVAGILDAMQREDVTQRTTGIATYFDVAGTRAVAYTAALDWLVSGIAVLLGVVAWMRVTRFVASHERRTHWILGFLWSALGLAAVVAGMVAATWLLRSAREVFHPWYAKPDRLFILLVAIAAAIAWAMTRLGRWFPARARGLRHPAVVWTYALPVWIVLALGASWLIPAAGYLWTMPLLAAGLLLFVTPMHNPFAVRIVSLLILAVAATLWVRDVVELLRFAVAVLGRLPLVTPVYAFAALIAVAGLMVAPPFIAVTASERPLVRPAAITVLCLLAVAVAMGMAYTAPAYTEAQPLRRDVRAFQDDGASVSLWQVGSNEPGLDVAAGGPSDWKPGRSADTSTVPRGQLRNPFLFSGTAAPLGPPPAQITAYTVEPLAGGLELAIAVTTREAGVTVAFVLPQGVEPARSSLPGVMRLGRWTAVYIAPPPEGIAFRARFNGPTADILRNTRVTVTSARLPGGAGWQSLPPWLPQDRMVWTARATWVLPTPPPAPSESASRGAPAPSESSSRGAPAPSESSSRGVAPVAPLR